MLCRPANSNIDPQIKYHNRHIDDIEHQRHQFQNKRSTSIACPRNRLKIDIPRNYKNIGRTKDKQRRKRCRNKIGHIGVNAQDPIGTKDKKQYNQKHKQICHTDTLIQRAPYIASISSSYQITDERTTSCNPLVGCCKISICFIFFLFCEGVVSPSVTCIELL